MASRLVAVPLALTPHLGNPVEHSGLERKCLYECFMDKPAEPPTTTLTPALQTGSEMRQGRPRLPGLMLGTVLGLSGGSNNAHRTMGGKQGAGRVVRSWGQNGQPLGAQGDCKHFILSPEAPMHRPQTYRALPGAPRNMQKTQPRAREGRAEWMGRHKRGAEV